MKSLYDVVYEPPAISQNTADLPGWAAPALIIIGAAILLWAVISLIKKMKK